MEPRVKDFLVRHTHSSVDNSRFSFSKKKGEFVVTDRVIFCMEGITVTTTSTTPSKIEPTLFRIQASALSLSTELFLFLTLLNVSQCPRIDVSSRLKPERDN